jgi:hypothetical protein
MLLEAFIMMTNGKMKEGAYHHNRRDCFCAVISLSERKAFQVVNG